MNFLEESGHGSLHKSSHANDVHLKVLEMNGDVHGTSVDSTITTARAIMRQRCAKLKKILSSVYVR